LATKKRVPMQVAPEFEKKIKEIQKAIMIKQGKNMSIREITKNISINPDFTILEKKLLEISNRDIKLNLDRRSR